MFPSLSPPSTSDCSTVFEWALALISWQGAYYRAAGRVELEQPTSAAGEVTAVTARWMPVLGERLGEDAAVGIGTAVMGWWSASYQLGKAEAAAGRAETFRTGRMLGAAEAAERQAKTAWFETLLSRQDVLMEPPPRPGSE
jgi:hypothetical protein